MPEEQDSGFGIREGEEQVPGTGCQVPGARWKTRVRSQESEVRNSKIETGKWKLETVAPGSFFCLVKHGGLPLSLILRYGCM
jgi:hypothetical protein